jgi:cell division transport system ATP-binding protein
MIVADEPTGNLDQGTAMDILSLLMEINRKGTTVVMATHAKDLVREAKKRVVVLDQGSVVANYPAGELPA